LVEARKPGSVSDIASLLSEWAMPDIPGMAAVEYASEFSKEAVINQLRMGLAPNKALIQISVTHLSIQTDTEKKPDALSIIQSLEAQLSVCPPQALVCIEGLRLFKDPQQTEELFVRLNLAREQWASFPVRQIWWMLPDVYAHSLRIMPDLLSWFMPRLHLTEQLTQLDRNSLFSIDLIGSEPAFSRHHYFQNDNRLETQLANEEAFYLQALTKAENKYGSEHPDIGVSLANLANIYFRQGRYDEAVALYAKELRIQKKLLGLDHPNIASRLNHLGQLYASRERYIEAEPLFENAVESYKLLTRRNLTFNALLARSLFNLSNCYSHTGRINEALQAILNAVGINKRLADENPKAFNPSLANSLNSLAYCYSNLGRQEEALQAILNTIEIYKALAQEDPQRFNPGLALSLNNLSMCYSEMLRHEEALQAITEAISILGPIFKAWPLAFNPSMSTLMENYRRYSVALGQNPDPTLIHQYEPLL